jgi:hypothetical protein
VELLVPCILHLENRIGEKMMTITLQKAFDDFRGPKEDFIQHMEKVYRIRARRVLIAVASTIYKRF